MFAAKPVRTAALVMAAILLAAAAPSPPLANLFGVPGLTLAGVSTTSGVLMFGIYLIREWRETRKLSSEDRLARREGYARQVEALLIENRKLRADIDAAAQMHTNYRRDTERMHDAYRHECQRENDDLRAEVRELHGLVDGMRRAELSARLSTQRTMMEALPHSEAIDRAVDALDHIRGVGE